MRQGACLGKWDICVNKKNEYKGLLTCLKKMWPPFDDCTCVERCV